MNVELTFEAEAMIEIAKKALDRKTGARGLRAIVENILLETMFEVPSKKNVKSVCVSKEAVNKDKQPEIAYLSKDEEKERENSAIAVVPVKLETKA